MVRSPRPLTAVRSHAIMRHAMANGPGRRDTAPAIAWPERRDHGRDVRSYMAKPFCVMLNTGVALPLVGARAVPCACAALAFGRICALEPFHFTAA